MPKRQQALSREFFAKEGRRDPASGGMAQDRVTERRCAIAAGQTGFRPVRNTQGNGRSDRRPRSKHKVIDRRGNLHIAAAEQ